MRKFRSDTKGAVHDSWRKQQGTDEWLQKAVSFKHDLCLTNYNEEDVKNIYDDLFGNATRYKIDEKIKQLKILIANLIQRRRLPLAISMNTNNWKKSRYTATTKFILELVNELTTKKYIKREQGINDKNNQFNSRISRIWATDKLLSLFPVLPNNVGRKPLELVELTDWDGKLIDYRDFDYKKIVRPIRETLKAANTVNGKAQIIHGRYEVNTTLVAIFKEDFTMYGRIHTRGYRHLQSYSGDERAQITIDGQKVVELDYKALHPHLLYAEENIQLNFDPYTVVDGRKELRPLLKQILLSMLNGEATGKKSALKGATNALYKQQLKRWQRQEYNSNVSDFPLTDVKPIIEAFKKEHKAIAQHFFNGKRTGLKIMNKDSKIALDVIKHFVKKEIPILPIHDSFIVQEQYRDELEQVMKQVYKEHTGYEIEVK